MTGHKFYLWDDDRQDFSDGQSFIHHYGKTNSWCLIRCFKYLTEKMFYPCQIDALNFDKLNDIHPEALEHIQKRRMKLMIFFPYEGYNFNHPSHISDLSWTELIRKYLHKNKISESNVVLVYGDLNFRKNFETEMHVIPFNCFEYYSTHDYDEVQKQNNWTPLLQPTVDFKKDKIFLFKNAVTKRVQRQAFYIRLRELGLTDYCLMSWLNRYETKKIDENLVKVIKHHFDLDYSFEEIQFLNEKVVLDFEELPGKKQAFLTNETFTRTWYSLVMETLFEKDINFVTEKTYQPIINFHPFLIASTPYALKNLHEDGYETFPEVFDESYDKEEDSAKRFAMIVEQVRLSCQPGFEEKFKQPSVREKLLHNRKNWSIRKGNPHIRRLLLALSALA